MSYENNPLIANLIGKHGITAEIAAKFPNDPVKFVVTLGDKEVSRITGLSEEIVAGILDNLHDAYSGIPAKRRGGRDGSGMMM